MENICIDGKRYYRVNMLFTEVYCDIVVHYSVSLMRTSYSSVCVYIKVVVLQ